MGNGDRCHCQGHRAIVVIGNANDRSIAGALTWALGRAVEHRLFYPAGSGDPRMLKPQVPNAANNGWVDYKPAPAPSTKARAVGITCKECCYLEEVLVIAHGHQQGLWRALVNCLPDVTRGKPMKRLVLWVCSSAAEVYPHNANNQHLFENLVFLAGPPVSCPCGCDPALCNAWNAKKTKQNLKCPHSGECTELVAAGWYQSGATNRAAKLGLDPNDGKAPFRLTRRPGPEDHHLRHLAAGRDPGARAGHRLPL
jgi:hypothetical protein